MMSNKRIISFFLIVVMSALLVMTGCAENTAELVVSDNSMQIFNEVSSSNAVSDNILPPSDVDGEISQAVVYSLSGNMIVKMSKYDSLTYYNEETATKIYGNDGDSEESVSTDGLGALVSGNKIELVESGTYILSGTFVNKCFYINVPMDKKIHIVLAGVKISSDTTSPIFGAFGDKMIITLAEGTVNEISDSLGHANDSANGCLFSTMDTTINGTGKLIVNGKYSSGISVKKDLKICGGDIEINAVNNGIKGNNSVSVIDSNIVINAKDDGIKSSEEEEKSKGFVFILDSIVEVTAEDDVVQAPHGIVIRGNSQLRGRSYGSMLNCNAGYIEGDNLTFTWE